MSGADGPAELPDEKSHDSDATTLQKAKQFLQDKEVQATSREQKIEFLKSKGLQEQQIVELVDGGSAEASPRDQGASRWEEPEPKHEERAGRPPIITYPEFLTKPARPPPLVTIQSFLNTLYMFAGFSTALYGTSKLFLTPMVDSLTDARLELHDTTAQGLSRLNEKLAATVSELPSSARVPIHPNPREGYADDESSTGDPSEMFHRDIGVQTSPPRSPLPSMDPLATRTAGQGASALQAKRLASLVASIREVSSDSAWQQGDGELGSVRSALDALREEVDGLSRQRVSHFTNTHSTFGGWGRDEPDDEIKKAKENIRRVKGVLLSTRNFPASTR